MKVGRNEPCPCGSGKKYKHCCYAKDSVKHEAPAPEEPATDETEATNSAEADTDTASEDHGKHRSAPSRGSGRARFQGEARGRSTTFTPRTHRGSQRGQ